MTTSLLRVALPKLFLWSEPGRIQEYPEAASRATAGRVYSREELEREVFDIAPTMLYSWGGPRGKRTDGIINTIGLERSGSRYRINGINLFERQGKGLRVTGEGIELGRAFLNSDNDKEWARHLARQLLRREPRTRLVIGLCLRGWQLGIQELGGNLKGSLSLISPDGYILNVAKRSCDGFNSLLDKYSELALGPSWRSDLESLGESGGVAWEGIQGGVPSTSDLPTALKKALAVFFHLGAFNGGPSIWELQVGGLTEALGIDGLSSLGFDDPTPLRLTDDEAFIQAIKDCAGTDGFVIVSQLADRFGALLHVSAEDRSTALDRYVRTATYHNHLTILARHPGQPRMGRGLLGDSSSRRIRVEFIPIHNDSQLRSADHTLATTTSQMQGEDL